MLSFSLFSIKQPAKRVTPACIYYSLTPCGICVFTFVPTQCLLTVELLKRV